MKDGAPPRHLATPSPQRRRQQHLTGLGLAVVLVLVAGTWIWRGTTGSGGTAPDRPAGPSAAAPTRATNAATATTGTAPTTTAAVQAAGAGPRNLLPNASFEGGAEGWRPIGGARLARTTESTEGAWSLRIQADPAVAGPVGITVPDATLTKANGRYHTNAWVRPSAPGTTVTIGLREYKDGRAVPGSNTLGWTVERAGWRQFGAIHVAGQGGTRLALEIMARDLPPGGYLDVDDVVLHLLPSRS
jgi:hypothetical protein